MRWGPAIAVAAGLLALGLAGCAAPPRPKIGVLLPTATSARWEADRRHLAEAFEAAGIDYEFWAAPGPDIVTRSGITVLVTVNIDEAVGRALLGQAREAGITTIDYDRLTPGGGADYYVGFDAEGVGRLQGEGLVRCLTDAGARTPVVAYLNGSPTDVNATLFRDGYDEVLAPRFASGEYVRGPEDSVPDWDGTLAEDIFAQQLARATRGIDGVVAANDTLASAAIAVLRRDNLAGVVPVTGMDATVTGLRNVLLGHQCMTAYRPLEREVEAAAALAVAVARGESPAGLTTLTDAQTGRAVPARLTAAVPVFRDGVRGVVASGRVARAQLCAGEFAAVCADAGV
jgi:D-xylose transport system substrate-binding protein